MEATPTLTGTVEVQWEGPQSRANVDGYVVRYSPTTRSCEEIEDGEVAVNGSEITRLEVSGMAAGAEYHVTVAAFNFIGAGEFSVSAATVVVTEKG